MLRRLQHQSCRALRVNNGLRSRFISFSFSNSCLNTKHNLHKSELKFVTRQRSFESVKRAYSSKELPNHEMMGLPALSPTMEKGNIVQWLKQEGDEIGPGDIVAEIETDKAVMELEAQDDYVLAKILLPEGSQDIKVGDPIAVTVEDADDVAAFADYVLPEASEAAQTTASSSSSPPSTSSSSSSSSSTPSSSSSSPQPTLPDGFEHLGMPALSPTMEQGNIVAWKIKEGDSFSPGDIVAEIETDKAVMEFEAQDEGVLAKILCEEGSSGLRVGQPIAVITEDEDIDISQVADYSYDANAGVAATPEVTSTPEPTKESTPQPSSTPSPSSQPTTPINSGDRVSASPFARRRLAEAGVSPAQLAPGSGPRGRVVARDVANADLAALKASGSSAAATSSAASTSTTTGSQITANEEDYETIPHTNIRRVTAQRLTESKQQVPHYYLTMEMNIDKVLAARARLGESGGVKPSVNDFVIKAAAVALRQVPDVNASWTDDAILQYHNVDIAVAVATDRGLLTPIVQDADYLGVNEISGKMRELAGRAREGKLKPDEFQGGTFTISNLGMFGIKQFTAIINPPQSAILAVGGIEKRLVPTADGGYTSQSMLSVTMSCDHRVIDGAVGATWLQAFKRCMEDPINMVL